MLRCEYVRYDEDGYNCRLNTKFDDIAEVTSVSVNHMYGKTADDVETLYVPSALNTNFLPTKICKFFKNLKKIDSYSKTLKEFNKELLEGCDKLEIFHARYINITSLEDGIFDNLPNLKDVYFHQTSLETLSKDLFKNNPKIEKINFNTNRLKVIELQLEPEQRSNLKKFTFLENVCIQIGYDSADFQSSLQRVIDQISEKCQINAPTVAPLPETPDEFRIELLEKKIDGLEEFKKLLEDIIQTNTKNVNSSVSQNVLENEVLKIELLDLKKFFQSNVTVATESISNNYELLTGRVNKIQNKASELETKIKENSKIKETNKELQAEINHNKNIIIAIVCIQILTVGFAVFITIYMKLYSRLGNNNNNV